MALPAVRSEERRLRLLIVTKRRATGLLAVVAAVWVAITVAGAHATWARYVQATAEASLVGGLADWFAVTALFRRPLGLPIPHTAIVAERKAQFGATLGEFIQESLVTPAAIVERVRAADPVGRAAEWLAQPANGARVSGQAADGAVAVLDVLQDDEIRDALEEVIRGRVDAVALAPLAGRVLQHLTEGGRHDKAMDALLVSLDRYLDDHRDELRRRMGDQSPWWLPGAVEDRIFERLLDGARSILAEMVVDHGHHLRRQADLAISRLADELQTSPALRERGEALKRDLLTQPQVRDWAGTVWAEAKAELRRQAGTPESPLRTRLAAALTALGERLCNDAALRARVEESVEAAVCTAADHFHGEVATLVSATIDRWDGAETSRRLELLLGPDLQYIRINGTVVGAAAGLVLYALSRAA